MVNDIAEIYGAGPNRLVTIDRETGICSVVENGDTHQFYPSRVPHVYYMEGWQGRFNGSFFEGESIKQLFVAHIDTVYHEVEHRPEAPLIIPAFGGLVSYYFLLRKYFSEKNSAILQREVHFTTRAKYGDRNYLFLTPLRIEDHPEFIVVDDNADTCVSYFAFCETVTGVYGPDERILLYVFSRKSYTDQWPGNYDRVPVVLQPFWATTGGGMEGAVFPKDHPHSSSERLFDGFLTAPPFSGYPLILREIEQYGALIRERSLATGDDDPLFHFHFLVANIGAEFADERLRMEAQLRFLIDFHATMMDLFPHVVGGRIPFNESVMIALYAKQRLGY